MKLLKNEKGLKSKILKKILKVEDDEEKRLEFVQQWFKKQIRGIEQNCPHLVAERGRQLDGIRRRVETLGDWPEIVTVDGVPDLWKLELTRLAYDLDQETLRLTEEDDESGIRAVRVPVRKVEGEEKSDIEVSGMKFVFTGKGNEATCTHYLMQAGKWAIARMPSIPIDEE